MRLQNIPKCVANSANARKAFDAVVVEGRSFREVAANWDGPRAVKDSTIANYAIDFIRTNDYSTCEFERLLKAHALPPSYQDLVLDAIEGNGGNCLMRDILSHIERELGTIADIKKAMVYNYVRLIIVDLCRKQSGVDYS